MTKPGSIRWPCEVRAERLVYTVAGGIALIAGARFLEWFFQ